MYNLLRVSLAKISGTGNYEDDVVNKEENKIIFNLNPSCDTGEEEQI